MYKQKSKYRWLHVFLGVLIIASTIWLPKTAQAEDAPVFPVGKTFEEVMPDAFTRLAFGAEIMQTTEAEYMKNERKYATRMVTQADFDHAITSRIKYEDSINFTFNTEGMQYLRNLEVFRFYSGYTGVDMEDLSYLAPLKKLRELSLGDVRSVTDLSPLSGLTNLEYLFLWSNTGITDLSPLAQLTKLEQLELNKTSVTSIAPLRNLTRLKKLTINGYFDDAWTLKDLPLLQRADTSYTIRTTVKAPSTVVGKPMVVDISDIFGNVLTDPYLSMDNVGAGDIGTFENGIVSWSQVGSGTISRGYTGKNKYQIFNVIIQQEVKPQVAGQAVTVAYETETGDMLAEPVVLQGMQEFSYEAMAKAIDGYTLVAEPSNATGVFTDQSQTVRFVYKKVETGSIHVHYVDVEGKTVRESDVYTGNVGDSYQLTWPTIAGYQVKEAPTPTGQYTSEAQEITLVYIPAQEPKGIVAVQYVDDAGEVLRAQDRYEGKVGEAYTLTWPTIPEYRLVQTPEAEGIYEDGMTTLRVVYSMQEKEVVSKDEEIKESLLSPTPDTNPDVEQVPLEEVPSYEKTDTSVVATILAPGTSLPVASLQEAGSHVSQPVIGERLPVTGDTSDIPIASICLGIFCCVSGVWLWIRQL
ncbi:hypothetical protein HB848_09465 [Listeria rocourtiae]|uniref:MucBP domain-containing protein n=1 Tax=Listeria rocourtiae TaxID=647910 RepID=UPI00162680FB|nr:MucBP domain-containing protein [Listeria rocourtiae]MBC1435567.1 hypothetical protein [Listeria rocourtiae]